MALKEYIPGAEMAGNLLERGGSFVKQKAKEAAMWLPKKAIHAIGSGVRTAARMALFGVLALPIIAYRVTKHD